MLKFSRGPGLCLGRLRRWLLSGLRFGGILVLNPDLDHQLVATLQQPFQRVRFSSDIHLALGRICRTVMVRLPAHHAGVTVDLEECIPAGDGQPVEGHADDGEDRLFLFKGRFRIQVVVVILIANSGNAALIVDPGDGAAILECHIPRRLVDIGDGVVELNLCYPLGLAARPVRGVIRQAALRHRFDQKDIFAGVGLFLAADIHRLPVGSALAEHDSQLAINDGERDKIIVIAGSRRRHAIGDLVAVGIERVRHYNAGAGPGPVFPVKQGLWRIAVIGKLRDIVRHRRAGNRAARRFRRGLAGFRTTIDDHVVSGNLDIVPCIDNAAAGLRPAGKQPDIHCFEQFAIIGISSLTGRRVAAGCKMYV